MGAARSPRLRPCLRAGLARGWVCDPGGAIGGGDLPGSGPQGASQSMPRGSAGDRRCLPARRGVNLTRGDASPPAGASHHPHRGWWRDVRCLPARRGEPRVDGCARGVSPMPPRPQGRAIQATASCMYASDASPPAGASHGEPIAGANAHGCLPARRGEPLATLCVAACGAPPRESAVPATGTGVHRGLRGAVTTAGRTQRPLF